jgi:hypothetical protein
VLAAGEGNVVTVPQPTRAIEAAISTALKASHGPRLLTVVDRMGSFPIR